MASIMFTCTVSCTPFFYVLKINSIISVHTNNTKLSTQVIFPQKRHLILDKTVKVYLQLYPEMKKKFITLQYQTFTMFSFLIRFHFDFLSCL